MKNKSLFDKINVLVDQRIKNVLKKDPVIPKIAAAAVQASKRDPDFLRLDQGQCLGVMPEIEIPYGPPGGLPQLRELVAKYWTYIFDLPFKLTDKNVAITTGATEALSIILRLLAPGKTIGTNWIYWSNYLGIIQMAGGDSTIVPLYDDKGLTLDRAERIILDKNVKILLLNFPANPSGEGLVEEEYQAIAELARKLDLIIISDEVYSAMAYEGRPRSFLAYAPERTIVIGAASKEYLIPGARVGYVITADEMFSNNWMPKLVRASTSNPNVLGQKKLIEIMGQDVKQLEQGKDTIILSRIKGILKRRRDVMINELQEAGIKVRKRLGRPPFGGISVLAYLPDDLGMSDLEFTNLAIEKGYFSVVPGSSFGASGGLRIGYGTLDETGIKDFVSRFKDLLNLLKIIKLMY